MRTALFAAAIILTGGCASVQHPIDAAAAEGLKGQRLAATYGKKPSFMARTPGKAVGGALLGPIGVAVASGAMTAAGNEIVAKNNIADPASAMTDELVTAIEKQYRTLRVAGGPIEAATDEVEALAAEHPDVDLLVDVRTTGWSLWYYEKNWSRYRVMYWARARLIDVKSGTVLAEGTCKRDPDQTDKSPTYDELMKDNAAGLKGEIQASAAACLDLFKTETFKLSPARDAAKEVAALPAR